MRKKPFYSLCFFFLFLFLVAPSYTNGRTVFNRLGLLNEIVLSRIQSRLEVEIFFNPYSSHHSFELSLPNRIVIDLFDIEDIKTSRYFDVNAFGIKAIRAGMFKTDVARVVFDLEERIPFYRIQRIPGGLKVLFGEEETSQIKDAVVESYKIQVKEPGSKEEEEPKSKEEIKNILIEEGDISNLSQTQQAVQQKPAIDKFSLEERISPATALNQGRIEIDGELDEVAWNSAQVLTGFIQYEPDEGTPATERTEVRVLYSDDSLYVGVRAFDSEAKKIKAILARRDTECPSDWITIWLDSYHDHLTAFEFAVNPSGVKRDTYWSNDYKKDVDWDGVWDVAVAVDEQGWLAEFRIPHSQIRFPVKEEHTWGFQVSRIIARKNETTYWGYVPKGVLRFVSLFGDLKEIRGIPPPKRLQVLPYIMGRNSLQPAEEGNPFQQRSEFFSNSGLDLKYGVSSNLTLDATFNPDFGQVEADPGQVNLTIFETYFAEKRPFFIEGKDIFDFPLGFGAGRRGRESMFYSRRIGRPPQGSPVSAQYTRVPENTTILGAFKLTGKPAKGLSIGLMEALTGMEQAILIVSPEGERIQETVEPLTNYFLGGIEKEFREGRTVLGMSFTAVNRRIENERLDFLHKAAYSAGLVFRHRFANDTYEASGYFFGSHVLGSEEAILRTQTSSVHYYQRQDGHHMELDPSRTSLSGSASSFILAKIGGGHWRWSLSGLARSPGFEVNDMGYLIYADWLTYRLQVSYNEYKPGKIFRDYDISLGFFDSYDYAANPFTRSVSFSSRFRFINYWQIEFGLNRTPEHMALDQLRGGPNLLVPGNWRLNGNFRTDSKRDFYLSINGSINRSDQEGSSYTLSSGFNMRLSSNLNLSLSPSFSDSINLMQHVTTETVDDQDHYILGRIDRKQFSLTIRFDYTITPTLSLQLYSQPFFSAGKYSEYKEAVQPKEENYADRWHFIENQELSLQNGYYRLFLPWTEGKEIKFYVPDFNFRQFRLNLVIRWEYLPGSTLFLVWTNGMNDYAKKGTLSLRDDLRSLLSAPSTNIFLVKISYWFNI